MAVSIPKEKTYPTPVAIHEVLQCDDFYRTIIAHAPQRSLVNLSDRKLTNFKNNYLPKILVFLNGFYTVNSRIEHLRQLNKLQSFKYEISTKKIKKLFHSNYYKAIIEALKEFDILVVQKGYSTKYNKITENYLPKKEAVRIAKENGDDEPEKAQGWCKRYWISESVVKSANQHELIDVDITFGNNHLETFEHFFRGLQEDDHYMLPFLKSMADKIVLDEDVQPTKPTKKSKELNEDVIYKETIYDRLKKGDTRIKRKSRLNKRLVTDHANCERNHLKYLKIKDERKNIKDERKIASLDINNSMPAFTIIELKKRLKTNDGQYNRLFDSVSTGQVYELLQDIIFDHIGKKYTRKQVKDNFRYVMYLRKKELFRGSIALHIYNAIEEFFPAWNETINFLNSKKSFDTTFGISGLFQNWRNSKKKRRKGDPQNYIFFHYALWESEFMFKVSEIVIHAMGRIPFATRYDGVLVAENDADQVLEIMNRVSGMMHEIPIMIHEENIYDK